MGSAGARALMLQRVQVYGSPRLAHTAICTRPQLSPGLQGVPALIRSSNITRNFASLVNSRKSFNISTALDSSFISTSGFIVTRASMKPSFGSPCADLHLGARRFGRGLASAVPPDSESVASTPAPSAHDADVFSPKEEDKKRSRGPGFFAIGAGIFSTILSFIIKFCGGEHTPFVKQAEKDIDKVVDFVDEGARLVVKVADEIEAIAHVAELSAQEAEDLALKVEAKTKVVRQTLDAIGDALEGDKKLSTVLTDYAITKRETTETPKGS